MAGRRYKILQVVGSGGFGTVYRAQLQDEGDFTKDVALKVVHQKLRNIRSIATRIRDEARLLGLLRHRAIVNVDGLVELDHGWAVVMEYVEGVTLRQVVGIGPVPISCALAIIHEVISALSAAWEHEGPNGPLHLIHRDLKPENLQLTAAGEVKILDFGLARARYAARESDTMNVVLGTFRYMAPERISGVDGPACDTYSLGQTLAELLTRTKPTATSPAPPKHQRIVEAAEKTLRTHIEDEEVIALILECLAYQPQDRPSHTELERRLWRLMQEYPAPRLTDWASDRAHLLGMLNHKKSQAAEDPLIGQTLYETKVVRSARREAWLTGTVAVLAFFVLFFGLTLFAIALGILTFGS